MAKKLFLIVFSLFALCTFLFQPQQISEASHYNSTKQASYYDDEEHLAFLHAFSGTAQALYVDVTSGTDGPYGWVACVVSPTRSGMQYKGYLHVGIPLYENGPFQYGVSFNETSCNSMCDIYKDDAGAVADMLGRILNKKY